MEQLNKYLSDYQNYSLKESLLAYIFTRIYNTYSRTRNDESFNLKWYVNNIEVDENIVKIHINNLLENNFCNILLKSNMDIVRKETIVYELRRKNSNFRKIVLNHIYHYFITENYKIISTTTDQLQHQHRP